MKQILPFVTSWMNLERIMYAKWSTLETEKYHMTSFYVELNKNLIDMGSRLVVTRGRGWRMGYMCKSGQYDQMSSLQSNVQLRDYGS